ncbi:MAG TPA: hypothetical protein VGK52_15640 [Polyangia bacterium]|jgi:hypothetical protein
MSLLSIAACSGGALDAGHDLPHGALPVDERNAIIVENDGGHDNWQGEFAVAFSAVGRLTLAGFIVNESPLWPDITANLKDWNGLVDAAHASGISAPAPIPSLAPPLQAPVSGVFEDTEPNRSSGAQFIVATAHRLGRSYRPLVVATGGQLTDVADAYLIDHTMAELVVVVSSLGTTNGTTATMGPPNGDLDPWANAIVAARYQYVQVNAYYDQTQDIPDSRVAQLPKDSLGLWTANKRSMLLAGLTPCDQISVIAAVLPTFAQGVTRMTRSGTAPIVGGKMGGGMVPSLSSDVTGNVWVVSSGDSASATNAFWQALTSL